MVSYTSVRVFGYKPAYEESLSQVVLYEQPQYGRGHLSCRMWSASAPLAKQTSTRGVMKPEWMVTLAEQQLAPDVVRSSQLRFLCRCFGSEVKPCLPSGLSNKSEYHISWQFWFQYIPSLALRFWLTLVALSISHDPCFRVIEICAGFQWLQMKRSVSWKSYHHCIVQIEAILPHFFLHVVCCSSTLLRLAYGTNLWNGQGNVRSFRVLGNSPPYNVLQYNLLLYWGSFINYTVIFCLAKDMLCL